MTTYLQHCAAITATSKWRLIGLPLLIALFVLTLLPALVQMPLAMLLGLDPNELVSLPGAAGMLTAITVGAWIMATGSKLRARDLGYIVQGAPRQILLGGAAGIVTLTVVGLLINLVGGTRTVYVFDPALLGSLLVGFLFFCFQGTWEELAYRAYLMPHFTKVMGVRWAVILTSVMFTALHGFNPGMQAMPVVNLMVYSLVFSLLYLRTGSLFVTGMAHGMWNFSQGFLFGSEVSGNTVTGSIFASSPQGPALLSGGAFGFEGSLITTLVGVLLIAGLLWSLRRAPQATGAVR